jgi:CRP-like cAMP-binding protein
MPREDSTWRLNRKRPTFGVDDLSARQPLRQIVHNCEACSSRPHTIFAGLDCPRLRELDQVRYPSAYPAGATVFLEGTPPLGAYCVCSGQIKLSTISSDGREAIAGIAAPGDILGVRPALLGRPHDMTAGTTEQTLLCIIEKNDFLEFLRRNGDVSLRLTQKLSADLYQAYRQIRSATLKRSAERLTELLVALCQTHGETTPEGISLRTNLCQEELAGLAGMSRRSLNRTLARLRDQGIIECGCRSILIRDSAALRNWLPSQEL